MEYPTAKKDTKMKPLFYGDRLVELENSLKTLNNKYPNIKPAVFVWSMDNSNYVDINFVIDERTGRIIMMGALDNLVKGAAGQAVQNMNLMFGFDEKEGLELVPCFP